MIASGKIFSNNFEEISTFQTVNYVASFAEK